MHIRNLKLLRRRADLARLPAGKLLINTVNAHSFNVAQRDAQFAAALAGGDVLLPDGASIVIARKWLIGEKIERIAGWDLFAFEMQKLNDTGGVCFFLGSSENVLTLIQKRAGTDFPRIRVITCSPPYRQQFTDDESAAMVAAINTAAPDLLWVGMTAPKQEKWLFEQWNALKINCHAGAIGAVFDFYAGTASRAPEWWQKHSVEWLHRLICEPRRMWKRYLIGNAKFLFYVAREKFFGSNNPHPNK